MLIFTVLVFALLKLFFSFLVYKDKTICVLNSSYLDKNISYDFLNILYKEGFKILKIKKIKLSKEQAMDLYLMKNFEYNFNVFQSFQNSFCENYVYVYLLERKNAISKLKEIKNNLLKDVNETLKKEGINLSDTKDKIMEKIKAKYYFSLIESKNFLEFKKELKLFKFIYF